MILSGQGSGSQEDTSFDKDDTEEEDVEILLKVLQERGEIVFSHNWEGGAGEYAVYVYKLDGEYYQYDMYQEEADGPFDSLIEALSDEMLTVTGATTRISCREMDFDTLAGLLGADATASEPVDVNDRDWLPEA
jgi:hypothetical protein